MTVAKIEMLSENSDRRVNAGRAKRGHETRRASYRRQDINLDNGGDTLSVHLSGDRCCIYFLSDTLRAPQLAPRDPTGALTSHHGCCHHTHAPDGSRLSLSEAPIPYGGSYMSSSFADQHSHMERRE